MRGLRNLSDILFCDFVAAADDVDAGGGAVDLNALEVIVDGPGVGVGVDCRFEADAACHVVADSAVFCWYMRQCIYYCLSAGKTTPV